MTDSIVIDGLEVAFEPIGDGRFRLLAGEREIGRVELVRDSTELVAFRPDGTPIRRASAFGGDVTARFSSREVAARALLGS